MSYDSKNNRAREGGRMGGRAGGRAGTPAGSRKELHKHAHRDDEVDGWTRPRGGDGRHFNLPFVHTDF